MAVWLLFSSSSPTHSVCFRHTETLPSSFSSALLFSCALARVCAQSSLFLSNPAQAAVLHATTATTATLCVSCLADRSTQWPGHSRSRHPLAEWQGTLHTATPPKVCCTSCLLGCCQSALSLSQLEAPCLSHGAAMMLTTMAASSSHCAGPKSVARPDKPSGKFTAKVCFWNANACPPAPQHYQQQHTTTAHNSSSSSSSFALSI